MKPQTLYRKRRRLHLRNPQKYSEFTESESMAIRAALSQGKGKKYRLSLSYDRDKYGKLTEVYVRK